MDIEQQIASAYDGYYVSDVLHQIKSGKEASVWRCAAQSHVGVEWLAVKVYRPLKSRGFQNVAIYQQGRYIGDARLRRAYHNKSKAGRSAQFGMWVTAEFETMRKLYAAGASVPKPYAQTAGAIIMEYIGEQDIPAPTLNRVRLTSEKAKILFDFIMKEIELWLSNGRIHADLSPFNILYWNGICKVIDFPQSVDPEVNASAFSLFERDINNIVTYFSKYGIQASSVDLACEMWSRNASRPW